MEAATTAARDLRAGWLLGSVGPLRVRSSMALIALVVYAVFALVQHGEVMLGLVDLTESNWLTLFNLCGGLGFYALIRSGLSERLSSEPSLTMPQMVFAIVSTSWSYAITGPARGAVISIMILVVMFGMFILQPRQARALALLAVVLLAAVMLWRSGTSPLRYPPREEGVHFLFTLVVVGGTSSLAIRLGRLRARLAQQKNELADALALNRELATRDALTGLLNRRAMVELLAREHPRIDRGQGPLAVAVLDIDWFKRINDNLGHGAGDEVLRRFAGVLKDELRAADALARWGGEEFLLLMPGTRLDDAHVVLDRLRRAVCTGDAFAGIAPDLKVSFSAGLVQVAEGEAQDVAIDRADRALYHAKQAGRNRVEVG
ncbi:MAG TPA: GGDEF domain-containing protein [Burkholderiaceae bacterium]|nr:GGDEF domain-containing protein [Burkholderiaceae bacterium]